MTEPKLGILSPSEAAGEKARRLQDARKTVEAGSLTPVSDRMCEGYSGKTEAVMRQGILEELADPDSWKLVDRVSLFCWVCNSRWLLAEGPPLRDPAAMRAFLLEMAGEHPISPCRGCGRIPELVIDRTLDGPSFRLSVGWPDAPPWWQVLYGGGEGSG